MSRSLQGCIKRRKWAAPKDPSQGEASAVRALWKQLGREGRCTKVARKPRAPFANRVVRGQAAEESKARKCLRIRAGRP
jgi:hypothetical protein